MEENPLTIKQAYDCLSRMLTMQEIDALVKKIDELNAKRT